MSDYCFTSGAFVSLDPAAGANKYAGVAYWAGGVLRNTGRIKVGKGAADEGHGARCLRIALQLIAWCASLDGFAARALVYEWPQIYGVGKSKGDPNHLTPLAGVGAALSGVMAAYLAPHNIALHVETYYPADWTLGIPKATTGDPWNNPRAALIKRQLSAEELAQVVASHDTIDGVGIGLAALGRYKPAPLIFRGQSSGIDLGRGPDMVPDGILMGDGVIG